MFIIISSYEFSNCSTICTSIKNNDIGMLFIFSYSRNNYDLRLDFLHEKVTMLRIVNHSIYTIVLC